MKKIELATLRFVAECLNQLRHRVPPDECYEAFDKFHCFGTKFCISATAGSLFRNRRKKKLLTYCLSQTSLGSIFIACSLFKRVHGYLLTPAYSNK
jgi:hypothetical protein